MADVPFWLVATTVDKEEEATYAPAGEWDKLVIKGRPVPGLAQVDASAALKVDQKKGAGKNGATPTFHGRNPAKIDVQIVIWTEPQLSALLDQLADYWPSEPDKKSPKPWDMYHPNLALLGIKSAYIVGVSSLKRGPVAQSKMMTWTLQEFRKGSGAGKSASITPASSVANVIAPGRLQQSFPLQAGDGTVLADPAPTKPSQDKTFTNPR